MADRLATARCVRQTPLAFNLPPLRARQEGGVQRLPAVTASYPVPLVSAEAMLVA